MVDALWSVEFFVVGTLAHGTGVAVLNNGRILGGDDGYCYEGSYKLEGGQIIATIDSNRYNPRAISIFGDTDHVSLTFSGAVSADRFEVEGHLVGVPNRPKLRVILTRRAEIAAS